MCKIQNGFLFWAVGSFSILMENTAFCTLVITCCRYGLDRRCGEIRLAIVYENFELLAHCSKISSFRKPLVGVKIHFVMMMTDQLLIWVETLRR